MGAATEGAPSGKSESLPSTTVIIVAGQQHEDGSGNHRADDAPQPGEPGDEHKLYQRLKPQSVLDSNAGPLATSAEIQIAMKVDPGIYAEGISRPESPESKGLQHRAYSANHKGRKENPGQITLGLSAGNSDDRRRGGHGRHAGHDILEAMKQRCRMAWLLIRLIYDILVFPAPFGILVRRNVCPATTTAADLIAVF